MILIESVIRNLSNPSISITYNVRHWFVNKCEISAKKRTKPQAPSACAG